MQPGSTARSSTAALRACMPAPGTPTSPDVPRNGIVRFNHKHDSLHPHTPCDADPAAVTLRILAIPPTGGPRPAQNPREAPMHSSGGVLTSEFSTARRMACQRGVPRPGTTTDAINRPAADLDEHPSALVPGRMHRACMPHMPRETPYARCAVCMSLHGWHALIVLEAARVLLPRARPHGASGRHTLSCRSPCDAPVTQSQQPKVRRLRWGMLRTCR